MIGWIIAACIALPLAIVTFCLFINHARDNRENGVYRDDQ